MTKTKAVLLGAFLLAFAAGTSLGLFVAKPVPTTHRSMLAAELNLTAEQSDKMQQTWADVMGTLGKQHGERRTAAAQERDQALTALLAELPEAQRARYEAIQQRYSQTVEELSQERKKAFDEAVERIKQMLTPEQGQKYVEWLKKQRERGGGGPGFRGPRYPRTAPASKPVANEQVIPHSGG